jgi:uncharacterized membrane protein YjgN (DUF898 family)
MQSDQQPAIKPGASVQPFAFTGSGSEYFGIWIVNLVLSILTLGIYSAWAKVRRLQYFYRHTEVAGATFDYHGDPIAILKGRLIALGLLLLWTWAGEAANLFGFLVIVAIAAALPWLLRNSFRFRMRNSSYRGLRFRFTGTTGGSYGAFLWRPLLAVFTLYLAWPWAHQRLKRYQHGNAWFGKAGFAFNAGVGAFYKEYLIIGLASLAVFIVPLGMIMTAVMQQAATQAAGTPPDPRAIAGTMFTAFALVLLGSLLIAPLFQARMQNLIWSNTALGPHRFESKVPVWRLFGIHVTNTLLVVLTLGFFMPWAAVRIARCRVEALTLVAADSLDAVVAEHEQELGATGEETAEMFDIDIAL